MRHELELERMTSPDVRAAIDEGWNRVVFACGAVEQHGPHLPLFTDAEHGSRLAEEVALRLGNTLVAPTVRVGCSAHHMSFAGTLSLRVETFEAICHDYCVSLARHGFRTVYIVPSHGGNFAPLVEMLGRLNEAAGPATRVVAFTDLQAQIDLWRRIIEEEAGLGSRVGGHADIAEGSIMTALHPELVREERAVPGFVGEFTAALVETVFRDGIGAVAPNGILGDARGISEPIGRRCIAETADMVAGFFRNGVASSVARFDPHGTARNDAV